MLNWSRDLSIFCLAGVTDPIVYVGVVEKGWASVEISVEGVQGHASKPPRESAIGVLAKAVAALVLTTHRCLTEPNLFGFVTVRGSLLS